MLKTFIDWVTWGALVLPLFGLAWSAVYYVLLQRQIGIDRKYGRFFELLEQIGRREYSNAAKMAAISELKKYSQYKDVVLRLCLDSEVTGDGAWLLEREFDLTAKHFGASGRAWVNPRKESQITNHVNI